MAFLNIVFTASGETFSKTAAINIDAFPSVEDAIASVVPEGGTWEALSPEDTTLPPGFVYVHGLFPPVPESYSIVYDLAEAKSLGRRILIKDNNEETQAISGDLTPNQIYEQSLLPPEQQIPGIGDIISELSALTLEMNQKIQLVESSTTVDEIVEITNPTSGVLFTGRGSGLGPEDLNVSYYTAFNSFSMTEAETELFVPGTSTVISYGSGGPNQFDSAGNCFAPGDYLIQIRQVSNSFVIAEFEVPLNAAGENVAF